MKLLKTIKEEEIDSNYLIKKNLPYKSREAVRAILFDEDNKIALERECKEETGCDIKISKEIGMIEEYRDSINMHQKSYCWISNVSGSKGESELTEKERRQGFNLKWVELDEAINLIKNSKPTNYEGQFIVIRDLEFLKEAKILLSNLN